VSSSFLKEESKYLCKSKKTMLIFRRMSQKKEKCTLELRHQRSCDVCFDWGVTVDDPEALIDSFLKDFPNKKWSKNEIASS
jgi:hypothetical protein